MEQRNVKMGRSGKPTAVLGPRMRSRNRLVLGNPLNRLVLMDGSLVLHHDEKEDGRSPDDISVRRLKNRERQRRYRARKRHEADMRKASIVDQSTPLHYQQMPTEFLSVPVEVEISVNLTSSDCLTRVHCQRDWKKDARRAHIHKKQETSPIDPSNSGIRSLAEADLLSDHSNTPAIDNNATCKLQSGRRHWKAEARNKKSSE
ncbi:hypothetical protein DH2020_020304 [Rehmannia glutinosa]|uniref:BZIP domain-containing protein n=1 Tax=Rehmannia glutinosa TaxID=99300 RepID=A0ABR0WH02_REHGL